MGGLSCSVYLLMVLAPPRNSERCDKLNICLCILSFMNVRENSMYVTADLFEDTGYSRFLAQIFTFRGRTGLFALHAHWLSKSWWISYIILNHHKLPRTVNGSVSALQKAFLDTYVIYIKQWAEQTTKFGFKKEFSPAPIGWNFEGGCCSVARGGVTEVWLLASL